MSISELLQQKEHGKFTAGPNGEPIRIVARSRVAGEQTIKMRKRLTENCAAGTGMATVSASSGFYVVEPSESVIFVSYATPGLLALNSSLHGRRLISFGNST